MDNTLLTEKKEIPVEVELVKAVKRHIGSDEMYHIRKNYGKSVNGADIRSICEIYSVADIPGGLDRYRLEPVFILSWMIFRNPGCADGNGNIPFEAFLHDLYDDGSRSTKEWLQGFLDKRYYSGDAFAAAIGRVFERVRKLPGADDLNYVKLLYDMENILRGGESARRTLREWAITMLVGRKKPKPETEEPSTAETVNIEKP